MRIIYIIMIKLFNEYIYMLHWTCILCTIVLILFSLIFFNVRFATFGLLLISLFVLLVNIRHIMSTINIIYNDKIYIWYKQTWEVNFYLRNKV